MCGIVGHIGPKDSVDIVLEGLKRLEYRGYDSSGVCYKSGSKDLYLFKKAGKLENLKKELSKEKHLAKLCIGHTRWATHGEVTDTNAHPHHNDPIAIVHNGIIENADDLRREFKKSGYEFLSQTDSEVFLILVHSLLKDSKNLQTAIATAFKKVTGNSAFVVLNKETDEIFAIKRGAPLVCGTNEETAEVMVSSDPYALVGMVNKLYFPEDNVLCVLSVDQKSLISFCELDGSRSTRVMTKNQDSNLEISEKGEFEHFMLKEIYEQPGLIRALPQYYFSEVGLSKIEKLRGTSGNLLHILACGTAWHAGLVIKNYVEKNNEIPCNVELASEFRYRNPLIRKNDLGLFISQSGETADTLASQHLCRDKKIKTLSIVNVEGSTLFRDCDENLLIRAGIEIGVASTKAFTQQALTGYLFSGILGNKLDKKTIIEKFELLAFRIDELLNRASELQQIAEEIYNKKGFIFTGRGIYFPIALEGALKLKEIAYVHAEGYASGELKHGPIALIDEEMVNIAIIGPELYDKTFSNIQEVKARRGIIVSLGEAGDQNLADISDYYFPMNFKGLGDLAPLYVNVANQLLAYYMAKFKGTDIDKPRNLAKSVTVE